MRDGWKEVTLGEIVQLGKGGSWGKDDQSDGLIQAVCLRGTDLAELIDRRIPEAPVRWIKESELRKSKCSKDMVLIETSGSKCGRSIVLTDEILDKFDLPVIYSNFCRTLTIDIKTVTREFVDIWFSYNYANGLIPSYRATSAMPNLDVKALLRVENIKVPPIPEQKRIVDLISSVDSYIEALQQQLESAKRSRNAFIESQILELSDSSLFSLKNLSTKIGSGATPRGGEEVYIETGVNLIRSQNVHDSNFVMRGLVAIEDSAAKALDNVTVEEGDVLINITGASVTRCCVVDSTILPARVNQHVAIIRSDRAKILPKYLVLVLTSNEVKGFLNDIAGTGSTRQALTKTHLEDLEIPVPSISKQAAIIENSDAFDATISKSQITLDRAKFLRSGLLSELLAGEHEIPASYDKVMGAA